MHNTSVRKYGNPPFRTVLVHGGPGAPGEMAPVARELSDLSGILEPFQTALSIEGQVEELKDVLQEHGNPQVVLIGFSWGAWLVCITAAQYPRLVRKLILVSSGPFEERYAAGIQDTRMKRLNKDEQGEIEILARIINGEETGDRKQSFERFGELFSKADTYDALRHEPTGIDIQPDIFQKVWPEAAELRRNGKLLEYVKQLRCPVMAIHGDYDPHPAEGVEKPLSAVLNSFEFVLLKQCGHCPWYEKHTREEFFKVLKHEIQ